MAFQFLRASFFNLHCLPATKEDWFGNRAFTSFFRDKGSYINDGGGVDIRVLREREAFKRYSRFGTLFYESPITTTYRNQREEDVGSQTVLEFCPFYHRVNKHYTSSLDGCGISFNHGSGQRKSLFVFSTTDCLCCFCCTATVLNVFYVI